MNGLLGFPKRLSNGLLSQPQRISNTNSLGGQFASGVAKEGGTAASTIGTSWLMDLAAMLNQLKHADFRGRRTYQPAQSHAVTGMPVSQVEKDYPIDFHTEHWDNFEDIPGTTDFWAKKLGIPFEHTTPETVGRLVGGILGMGAPLVPGTKAFAGALREVALTPGPVGRSAQVGAIKLDELLRNPVADDPVTKPRKTKSVNRATGDLANPDLLREKLNAEMVAKAPVNTEKSRHGKKLASGSTVGAPPQIKTKKQLAAWRERRLESIAKGAGYADWYERNSRFIDTITGGDNVEATGFARAGSSVSNQTTPAQELMYTARGSNQDTTGNVIKTGKMHNEMSPRFAAALVGEGEGGLKTDPYALHKMVEWDTRPIDRPTNDIWMVREFEYPEHMEAAGNAQHRWMDEQMEWLLNEANKRGIGGKTDWNYGTLQAAPWVYKKGMDEFKKAKNPLGDEQYYIDRAGQDWWTQAPDYTAQVTREWTPGKTSGHLPELIDAPPAVRDQYGDLLEGHVTDPKYGIDRVARAMGGLTLPSERSIGRYTDLEGIEQLNPGYNTNMLVGKRYMSNDSMESLFGQSPSSFEGRYVPDESRIRIKTKQNKKTGKWETVAEHKDYSPGMDESSAKLVDAVGSAHGLVGTQDQVARRYMTETTASKGAPQKRAGAIEFLRDEPFSAAEMKALQDDAIALGLDPPAKSTRGANSLVFEDIGAPERKAMNKAATELAEKYGARRRWSDADTDLYPMDSNFNAPSNWSAQPFIDRIKAAGDTVVEGFESVMRDIAPGMREEVKQFAKANNMTEAQWYDTMMGILSKPNAIKNLEQAVKDGIVPVAFLGVIGFNASNEGQTTADVSSELRGGGLLGS